MDTDRVLQAVVAQGISDNYEPTNRMARSYRYAATLLPLETVLACLEGAGGKLRCESGEVLAVCSKSVDLSGMSLKLCSCDLPAFGLLFVPLGLFFGLLCGLLWPQRLRA